eukprot:NODE_5145_length_609_cov_226.005415.p2 GENE.NODE_5145_length_609_cov_226.005415~~NODE_5145_length_609_cov_226.005415.p2  ORF type:complete len:169 (+),score=27.59 NODE_5145_length_609_cov_226.005415:3-509(+)
MGYNCPKQLGPSNCIAGHCECKVGTCRTYEGSCKTDCSKDTGGSCSWFACSSARGQTKCVNERCICQQSTDCATSDGVCTHFSMHGASPTEVALVEQRPAISGLNGPPAQSFAVLLLAFAVLALILRAMRGGRRRKAGGGDEPLLAGAERQEGEAAAQVGQHATATQS